MSRTAPSIPPLVTMPDWQAATDSAEREAAAMAWVRRGQRETGCEHVAIQGAGGKLIFSGTSGIAHRIAIPIGDGEQDVVIHHSHPDEASLSPADFHAAWRWSPGSEVRAYTPGGAVFAGRARIAPARWMVGRAAAAALLASELRILGRRDRRSYARFAFHVANTEMEALSLVWYNAELTAEMRDDLARLQADLPGLRASARQELERDGRT